MDEIVRRKLFFTSSPAATDTETQPYKLRNVYKTLAMRQRIVLNDFPDPNLFHVKAKKVAHLLKTIISDFDLNQTYKNLNPFFLTRNVKKIL